MDNQNPFKLARSTWKRTFSKDLQKIIVVKRRD